MKRKWMSRLLAFALMLVMTASLGAAAFADGYAADQSYTAQKDGQKVYAVCVSGEEGEEPAALRDRLLEEGYDAYLYESGETIRVLCGKFRSMADARSSRDTLNATGQFKAHVLFAWLPAEAVEAFEAGPLPEEEKAEPEKESEEAEAESGKDDAAASLQSSELEQVYSVALSTVQDSTYADALVAKMKDAGFDAFVLQEGINYRVLSGKFRDICNALLYRDCIWSNTDRTDTYLATISLPKAEVQSFLDDYEQNGLPGKIKENLEKPTGAFYREKNGQVLAYTVQFSAGTSFSGAERSRDAMTAAGYPSFVYDCARVYEIMSGAFSNKADAEAWCKKIHENTSESDAYVTTAWLPSKIVK